MRWIPGILSLGLALACYNATGGPITDITGTWGGENAGLIASDTIAHVHIGCTLGETKGPIVLDADGRFEVSGTYNVDAYPVDRGIVHPARFSGQIVGRSMILTVTLTDTARTLGPVTLTFGKEPKMGPCPICRSPTGMRDRSPAVNAPDGTQRSSTTNKESTWRRTSTKSSS